MHEDLSFAGDVPSLVGLGGGPSFAQFTKKRAPHSLGFAHPNKQSFTKKVKKWWNQALGGSVLSDGFR